MKKLLKSEVLEYSVEQEQQLGMITRIIKGIDVAIAEHGCINLNLANENQDVIDALSNHPRIKNLQLLGLLGSKELGIDLDSIQSQLDGHIEHIKGTGPAVDTSSRISRRQALLSANWSDAFISSDTKAAKNKARSQAQSIKFIQDHIAHANPQQLVEIAKLAQSGKNPLFNERLLPIAHICLTIAYFKTPKSNKVEFKNQHLVPFTNRLAQGAMDATRENTAAPNIELYTNSMDSSETFYPTFKALDRHFYNISMGKDGDYALDKEIGLMRLEVLREFRRAFKLENDRNCGGNTGPYTNSIQKTLQIESKYKEAPKSEGQLEQNTLIPCPDETKIIFFDKDGVLVGARSDAVNEAINRKEHHIIFSVIKSQPNTAYGIISSGGCFSLVTDPTLTKDFIPNVLNGNAGVNAYSEGDRELLSALNRATEFENQNSINPVSAILNGIYKQVDDEHFKYETQGEYKNYPSQLRTYYKFVDANAPGLSPNPINPLFALSFSEDGQTLHYSVPNPYDDGQNITDSLTLDDIKNKAIDLQQSSLTDVFYIIAKETMPDEFSPSKVYIYQNDKQETILASLDDNKTLQTVKCDLSRISPTIEPPVLAQKLNNEQKQQLLQQAVEAKLITIGVNISQLDMQACRDINVQEAILSLTTARNHTRGELKKGSKAETPLLTSNLLHIRPENSPIVVVIDINKLRHAFPFHSAAIGRNKLFRMIAALADLELALAPSDGLKELGIHEVKAPVHFKSIRVDQINFYDDDWGPVILAKLAGINAAVADSHEVKESKKRGDESKINSDAMRRIDEELLDEMPLKIRALDILGQLREAQDAPDSNTYLDHLAQTLDSTVRNYNDLESKYAQDFNQEESKSKGKEEEEENKSSVKGSAQRNRFFSGDSSSSSSSGPSESSSSSFKPR